MVMCNVCLYTMFALHMCTHMPAYILMYTYSHTVTHHVHTHYTQQYTTTVCYILTHLSCYRDYSRTRSGVWLPSVNTMSLVTTTWGW